MKPQFSRGRLLLLLSIVAAVLTANAAPEKRNITEKDLFQFVWIGDVQVSPDGGQVAFVRVTVNEKKEGYHTSIWAVPTAGNELPHRLTSGERDSSPRWSPDGKYLVFTRVTEKDGKPESPQLFILSMTGGDAFSFTSLPKGAGDPKWSPDGKMIAFTSTTNPEDLAKQEKKKQKEEELKRTVPSAAPSAPGKDDGKEKPKTADAPVKQTESEPERESDVQVVNRAVYRQDNEGNFDFKRPQHIWVVQAPRNSDEKVEPKQLTSGRFDEDNATWSKDSSQIYFVSLRVDEPYYGRPRTEFYSIFAIGGEPARITTIDMDTGSLALSPDGKQIAFIASATDPINSYTQPDLWVMDLAREAKPRNLTAAFDWDVGASVSENGAPRGGGGNAPIWARGRQEHRREFARKGKPISVFDVATGALTEITK